MRLSALALLAGLSAMADTQPHPTLIGGREAQPGDFPEVIYIANNVAGSHCSATVVGPRTILTAAHCVAEGGVIVPVAKPGLFGRARCNQSPLYESDDIDLALCRTDREISVHYATIASKGPKVGDVVTLSGYGCTDSHGRGGNSGALKWGEAKVSRLPVGPSPDIVTESDSTALCYGDSGGPAFKRLTLPGVQKHELIGVNSKGNIKDTSFLSAVYLDRAVEFIADWAKKHKAEICGVTSDCFDEKTNPK